MAEGLDPATARDLYQSMRGNALSATPASAGFETGTLAEDVAYGGLMEFRADDTIDLDVTLFCLLEERGKYVHVALYTSGGFMIVGENFPTAVFEAARRFIGALADYIADMTPTAEFPGPSSELSRFYAFTSNSVRTVEASDQDSHFSALFVAGHGVIAELQKLAL